MSGTTDQSANGIIDLMIAESSNGTPLMKSEVLPRSKLSNRDIELAVDHIKSNEDHTSYHLLFALRRQSVEIYRGLSAEGRARILCDALTHLTFLNDWGYLHPDGSQDGEAALALLELGRVALAPLLPVLEDSRPAPLFGSEPATISYDYQYRRKDFACRYILLILGREPRFDPDPQARDADIERLKTELASDK